MPNLRIQVGVNSFEVEGAPTLDLTAEIVDLAHQWLEAVADTAAEAQKELDTATANLKKHSDALEAVVEAEKPSPS